MKNVVLLLSVDYLREGGKYEGGGLVTFVLLGRGVMQLLATRGGE